MLQMLPAAGMAAVRGTRLAPPAMGGVGPDWPNANWLADWPVLTRVVRPTTCSPLCAHWVGTSKSTKSVTACVVPAPSPLSQVPSSKERTDRVSPTDSMVIGPLGIDGRLWLPSGGAHAAQART